MADGVTACGICGRPCPSELVSTVTVGGQGVAMCPFCEGVTKVVANVLGEGWDSPMPADDPAGGAEGG